MEITGHKQIIDFFDKVIEHDNISHAYCFVGAEMVGKKRVAKAIAAKLLEIEEEKLSKNPDFVTVEQELNQKTGKTKRNIDINQIRRLCSFVQSRPFVGKRKVAAIDGAEKMNPASANALLKTLEEPSDQTVLFLITEDETKLPETIQSRCQIIYFHPVKITEIEKALISLGKDKKDAEEISKFSHGLPGLAIQWVEDSEQYEWYRQEVNRFASLIGEPFYKKLFLVDELFGDKTDHIAARENLISILQIWQLVLRDYVYKFSSVENNIIHNSIDYKNIWEKNRFSQVYQTILEAKEKLQQNVHPRLLVEHILLAMP